MLKVRSFGSLLGASACAAAALLPASLVAQTDVRSSPVPQYHLMQVSVKTGEMAPKEFRAKTETIRSCGDAGDLAKALGADVRRNRFVRASALPAPLQDALKELPTGKAIEVFGDREAMRVLVICNRQ